MVRCRSCGACCRCWCWRGLPPVSWSGRLAWDLPARLVAFWSPPTSCAACDAAAFGVDIVALLAIAGALAMGEHLTAAIIALMVAGGGALEAFADARARRELSALLDRTPRIAHRQIGDGITDIPVDAVRPGDRLLVKPGEVVPVDGTSPATPPRWMRRR